MAEPVPLSTLREVLARVFPMEGVIVVGVGRGQGLADFGSAASMLLIDARAECVEALQKRSFDSPYCTAVQAVIAAQPRSAAFHIASKPDESGLIAPEALRPLWRNLTTHRTEEVEASTLPDLVARLELAADFRCSWLVVDCLPALPVLEGAGQLIDQVEVLELRCVRDEEFAPGQGVSLESVRDWLEPLGFRLVLEAEESHPHLVKAVFCRDLRKLGGRVGLLEQTIAELRASNDENVRVHVKEKVALSAERESLARAKAAAERLGAERQTQLEALTAELQQVTSARDALMKEHGALSAERDALVLASAAADKLAAERQTQLEALTNENKQLIATRDALANEKGGLTREIDKLAKEQRALRAECERLATSLSAEAQAQAEMLSARNALQEQLDECLSECQRRKDEAQLDKTIQGLADTLSAQNAELAEQLGKQNADLVRLRKQLLTAVKKEVLNGTQQLEAFLDIQNFFTHGEHLPLMHGWPVSPDFAHYLIQLLEKNDYDLILEFGSGSSTVIIARTLAHLGRTRPAKSAALQVAFEHLDKYHHQTRADLEGAGLANSVELTLAPLQPYQLPNGNTYLYYTCSDKLLDLATRLPTTPIRILLVVDGPPASTGQHARYPALPAVLAHLDGNNIDILLDDHARPDEKEVGALWEQDLEQLGYRFSSEKISTEKEALFITASPE